MSASVNPIATITIDCVGDNSDIAILAQTMAELVKQGIACAAECDGIVWTIEITGY